jgi:hypothetical protein
MTIGIVTSVYGDPYYGFLDRWSAAILELNTQPDWITIVHDGLPNDIQAKITKRLDPDWILEPRGAVFHPQIHVNTAISVTFTDWILKVDVDDVLLPHALDGVKDFSSDVVNFGYRIGETDHPSRIVSAEEVLQKSSNSLGSCSPFRRWIWEANGFEDRLYDDWSFWIKAARSGAIFDATGRVDYLYSQHPDQMTQRHDNAQALQEIRSL